MCHQLYTTFFHKQKASVCCALWRTPTTRTKGLFLKAQSILKCTLMPLFVFPLHGYEGFILRVILLKWCLFPTNFLWLSVETVHRRRWRIKNPHTVQISRLSSFCTTQTISCLELVSDFMNKIRLGNVISNSYSKRKTEMKLFFKR